MQKKIDPPQPPISTPSTRVPSSPPSTPASSPPRSKVVLNSSLPRGGNPFDSFSSSSSLRDQWERAVKRTVTGWVETVIVETKLGSSNKVGPFEQRIPQKFRDDKDEDYFDASLAFSSDHEFASSLDKDFGGLPTTNYGFSNFDLK